jgi:clan AA aspartic protease (TIGR02281 family)
LKYLILLLLIFSYQFSFCQSLIKINQNDNGYNLNCKVNGIPMLFLFDTGASEVSISITEANFLIKQGLLTENDFIGKTTYGIANGDIVDGTKIILRRIEIQGVILENVEAAIIHNTNASLLFGMSAINRIGKVVIENNTLLIYPNKHYNLNSKNEINNSNGSSISSIKIGNLEVMREDLTSYLKLDVNFMNWNEAKASCLNLKGGWRLPTLSELKIIYNNRIRIGGFYKSNWNVYWSSTLMNQEDYVWRFEFELGKSVFDSKTNFANVRAVRSI